jgi:hypothetical protein
MEPYWDFAPFEEDTITGQPAAWCPWQQIPATQWTGGLWTANAPPAAFINCNALAHDGFTVFLDRVMVGKYAMIRLEHPSALGDGTPRGDFVRVGWSNGVATATNQRIPNQQSCYPKVMCISPNAEAFQNGVTLDFGPVPAYSAVQGALWQGLCVGSYPNGPNGTWVEATCASPPFSDASYPPPAQCGGLPDGEDPGTP